MEIFIVMFIYCNISHSSILLYFVWTLTPCIEAVAESCIIVTWWSGAGGIQALSERPTGFLQCFDTVGLVIWPVKIVLGMTYNVSSGTLSLYTNTTTTILLLLLPTRCQLGDRVI